MTLMAKVIHATKTQIQSNANGVKRKKCLSLLTVNGVALNVKVHCYE